MDNKALYGISYGVYVLGTKWNGKTNGCVINACMQVASDPVRIAISSQNANYTCELLKKSGVFSVSLLDITCTFDTIKRFGMQSGRDTDKFTGISFSLDSNGVPYLSEQTCAVLSCHVVNQTDLGTHTLFIAEVDDAFRLNDNSSLTYSDYQTRIKPKTSETQTGNITGWRCRICGYVYEGSDIPKDFLCPTCGHDISDFEPVYG